jgi:hypothetical protein
MTKSQSEADSDKEQHNAAPSSKATAERTEDDFLRPSFPPGGSFWTENLKIDDNSNLKSPARKTGKRSGKKLKPRSGRRDARRPARP